MAIALATAPSAYAQYTASAVRGVVTDSSGAPVAGATVTIRHVPSGTTSTATSSGNGGFYQSGLRVGGPYEITVSAAGAESRTLQDVYLDAGQTQYLNISLRPIDASDEIVVTGRRPDQLDLGNGAGSSFDRNDISNQPSFGRDLTSTLLRDPLVNSTSPGTLSIGGLNPRFNGLSIDGVLQQDDFGLSNSTYPTIRSPISLDTVEAASVVASDYSVKNSGFQGGLVNVVTKSGTNEFHGSAYYYRSSDSLRGTRAFGTDVASGSFKNREYGVTLGGPIIKDRLFFFGAYEKFKNTSQVTQDFARSDVDPQLFDDIRSTTQSVYGFDPGQIVANVGRPQESKRWLGKIDWNVSDTQRATVSYQRTNDTDLSGIGVFNFPSAYYNTGRLQNAYSFQLYSDWAPNFSSTFRVGYKTLDVTQDSRANAINPDLGEIVLRLDGMDTPFLNTGSSTRDIRLGSDRFRHANQFNDKRFQVYWSGDWTLGDHVVTFGGEFASYNLFNVFVPTSKGQFRFDSLGAFQSQTADLVTYANVQSNDALAGATTLGYHKWAAFFQDEWQATSNLVLNAGVRAEAYSQKGQPAFRVDVASRTGVNNTANLDGLKVFQPRIGFRWTPYDNTKVTGGIGLYSGGDPKVWIANAFNQAAFSASAANVAGVDGTVNTVPASLLNAVATATALAPSDLIDPNFQIPSQWKASLRLDQTFDLGFLGDSYLFSAQYLYSREKNGYAWQNLGQLVAPIGVAPDLRPIYIDQDALGLQHDIELINTKGAHGSTFTFQVQKEYNWGLGFNVSYAHSNVKDYQTGASSRGVSGWRGGLDYDRNNLHLGPSIYQTKDKFAINFSYEHDFFENLATRIDLFGNIFSGSPFSYTFDVNSNNALFGRAGNPERPFDNDLLYIPAVSGSAFADPRVVFASGFDQQGFINFIDQHNIGTGQIFDKNRATGPWNQLWNLRFQQDLPFLTNKYLDGSRLKFVVDIDNIANLINKKWGTRRFSTARFNAIGLVRADLVSAADVTANGIDGATALTGNAPNTTCVNAGDCVYRYNTFTPTAFGGNGQLSSSSSSGGKDFANSVWQVRFGIRYEF